MTKDECRAKIVERRLAGHDMCSGLNKARLTYGCCTECGHNLCVTKISYGTGTRARDWDPQVVACKCGKIRRLWAFDRLHEPCLKCKQLPAPATSRFKSRRQVLNEETKVLEWQTSDQEVTMNGFQCPCGMTKPEKYTGHKPDVVDLT